MHHANRSAFIFSSQAITTHATCLKQEHKEYIKNQIRLDSLSVNCTRINNDVENK